MRFFGAERLIFSWEDNCGAIKRLEVLSRSDSDPIAMAFKTADTKLVSAQDFRLLNEYGDMVTSSVVTRLVV